MIFNFYWPFVQFEWYLSLRTMWSVIQFSVENCGHLLWIFSCIDISINIIFSNIVFCLIYILILLRTKNYWIWQIRQIIQSKQCFWTWKCAYAILLFISWYWFLFKWQHFKDNLSLTSSFIRKKNSPEIKIILFRSL